MIEATDRQHAHVVRWFLDPKCDLNAVRVQSERNGRLVEESRSTLRKIGDTWFPERTEFYSARFKDGSVPRRTIYSSKGGIQPAGAGKDAYARVDRYRAWR